MLQLDVYDDLDDVQEAAEMLFAQTSNGSKEFVPAILISAAILALAKEISELAKVTRTK